MPMAYVNEFGDLTVQRWHFKPSLKKRSPGLFCSCACRKKDEDNISDSQPKRRITRLLTTKRHAESSSMPQMDLDAADSDENDEPHAAIKLEQFEQRSQILTIDNKKAIKNWIKIRSSLLSHIKETKSSDYSLTVSHTLAS